jgi:outer membrane protein TolC
MSLGNRRRLAVWLVYASVVGACGCSSDHVGLILPEQQCIAVREPSELPKAHIPATPAPPTVTEPANDSPTCYLSLDDAIRIALGNSEVIRVLAGVTAVSSGRTIYDPAIANTRIDQEQGRFDPRLEVNNTFNRVEQPVGVLDPLDPNGARIDGTRTDEYDFALGLSQTNVLGGEASFDVSDNLARFKPGVFPLNPQNRTAVSLGYIQPLLQGAGTATNLAPIVIARIETERSYFQLKDSVQELVRGVIEAYWRVVSARTDVWARRQQVEQGTAAFERADARRRRGLGNSAEVAQARLALANFEATLIASEANLLEREAALRNILGLPPGDSQRFIPSTPPTKDRLELDWDATVRLAEERRPDLIELKLIIEADEQSLVLARNQALPRLDAVALYRWNGLEGETPSGSNISTEGGQFTDWTLGVNFSVPLGLRQSRAALRERQLVMERDRANLDQAMHAVVHDLASNTRNLAQYYEQYEAYARARAAARLNLDQQVAEFYAGRTIFLNVLQAITDWGNSVSAEALSLILYNTELANLELQTGTILETHGVHFYEERFGAIGPLGRLATPRCYPQRMPPTPNRDVYLSRPEPAENSFDLESPVRRPPRVTPN